MTVPASTDGTGEAAYIAGFLDRLDGGLPQWNPGGVVLTRVDATHWTITLTGKEDDPDRVQVRARLLGLRREGQQLREVANRQLTLAYGATGTQNVNDTVLTGDIVPCDN